MNLSLKQKFLLIGLIILFFRVFSALLTFGHVQLFGTPFQIDFLFNVYSPLVACALSVIISIQIFNKFSDINKLFVIMVLVVAFLPMSFNYEIAFDEGTDAIPVDELGAVKPASFGFHLIDDEQSIQSTILTNKHVDRAEAVSDKTFGVKIFFTPQGEAEFPKSIRINVGEKLGFSINGELLTSTIEMVERDDADNIEEAPYIVLPLCVDIFGANRIAAEIMKNK